MPVKFDSLYGSYIWLYLSLLMNFLTSVCLFAVGIYHEGLRNESNLENSAEFSGTAYRYNQSIMAYRRSYSVPPERTRSYSVQSVESDQSTHSAPYGSILIEDDTTYVSSCCAQELLLTDLLWGKLHCYGQNILFDNVTCATKSRCNV